MYDVILVPTEQNIVKVAAALNYEMKAAYPVSIFGAMLVMQLERVGEMHPLTVDDLRKIDAWLRDNQLALYWSDNGTNIEYKGHYVYVSALDGVKITKERRAELTADLNRPAAQE